MEVWRYGGMRYGAVGMEFMEYFEGPEGMVCKRRVLVEPVDKTQIQTK